MNDNAFQTLALNKNNASGATRDSVITDTRQPPRRAAADYSCLHAASAAAALIWDTVTAPHRQTDRHEQERRRRAARRRSQAETRRGQRERARRREGGEAEEGQLSGTSTAAQAAVQTPADHSASRRSPYFGTANCQLIAPSCGTPSNQVALRLHRH